MSCLKREGRRVWTFLLDLGLGEADHVLHERQPLARVLRTRGLQVSSSFDHALSAFLTMLLHFIPVSFNLHLLVDLPV